jgi:hypothetical protein
MTADGVPLKVDDRLRILGVIGAEATSADR